MLLSMYEWLLEVLRNDANEPVASWTRGVISYDTTPFLLDDPEFRINDNPSSVVVRSVEELVQELESPPGRSLENVNVHILCPGTGTEPVFELWTYQSGHDETVYYAYCGRDDTLLPCNREQPQTMMGLRRRFRLGGRGSVVGDRPTASGCEVARLLPVQ